MQQTTQQTPPRPPTPPTSLANREVVPTFNALSTIGKFPPGLIALKVARIIAALIPEARHVQTAETQLVEEFALRDEDGTPKTQASADGERVSFMLDPRRHHEYTAKYRELMEDTVVLRVPRLAVSELEFVAKKVGLDPHLAAYLLPFVDDPIQPVEGDHDEGALAS